MRPPGLITRSVRPSHNRLRRWIPTNSGIIGRHFQLKNFNFTHIFGYASLGPVAKSEMLLKNSSASSSAGAAGGEHNSSS
jgi:hypothetical protein